MSTGSRRTASVATAAERAAIGTVLVQISEPLPLLRRFFSLASGRALTEINNGRIYFGQWGGMPDTAGEEVVVAQLGKQLEIHCHGGRIAAQRIMADLVSAGVSQADWLESDFPASAASAGGIAKAAYRALAEAMTTQCALTLVDQVNGALDRELQTISECVSAGHFDEAIQRLDRLLSTQSYGLHLVTPWKVALIGKPNVGKSSLLNAISGFDRAIVFDQPGTTRDLVTVQTAIDGWPFEFVDTAGIRETMESVEEQGVQRSMTAAKQADCVLLITDLSAPWEMGDEVFCGRFANALIVHNKRDLATGADDRPAGIDVSAKTGEGLPQLLSRIVDGVLPEPPSPGQAVLFNESLIAGVSSARRCLRFGKGQETLRHLGAL